MVGFFRFLIVGDRIEALCCLTLEYQVQIAGLHEAVIATTSRERVAAQTGSKREAEIVQMYRELGVLWRELREVRAGSARLHKGLKNGCEDLAGKDACIGRMREELDGVLAKSGSSGAPANTLTRMRRPGDDGIAAVAQHAVGLMSKLGLATPLFGTASAANVPLLIASLVGQLGKITGVMSDKLRDEGVVVAGEVDRALLSRVCLFVPDFPFDELLGAWAEGDDQESHQAVVDFLVREVQSMMTLLEVSGGPSHGVAE